jgi:hypothetical protein
LNRTPAVDRVHTSSTTSATSRGIYRTREIVGAVLAAIGEALLVMFAVSVSLNKFALLTLHALLVVVLAAILFWRRRPDQDSTTAVAMLLVIAVAGPAGAAAALTMLLLSWTTNAGPHVIKAWYDRLADARGADPITSIHDQVSAGRQMRASDGVRLDFRTVIKTGTLAEKQAALGLMARRFHPDFSPALSDALRSDEPVVRVQAAAVVARVRGDLRAHIAALLDQRAKQPRTGVLPRSVELLAIAGCRFVDAVEAARCREVAERDLQGALATSAHVQFEALHASDGVALAIDRHLIQSGRYRDFRVSRRLQAIAAQGEYRIRRLKERVTA